MENFGFDSNDKREVIKLKLIQTVNEGEVHKRTSTQVIDEISKIGGLSSILLTLGSFVYLLAEPIRNLKLAVAFNKLLASIAEHEGVAKSSVKIDTQHEK